MRSTDTKYKDMIRPPNGFLSCTVYHGRADHPSASSKKLTHGTPKGRGFSSLEHLRQGCQQSNKHDQLLLPCHLQRICWSNDIINNRNLPPAASTGTTLEKYGHKQSPQVLPSNLLQGARKEGSGANSPASHMTRSRLPPRAHKARLAEKTL